MSENKEFTETVKKQILAQLETIKTKIEKQQERIKELQNAELKHTNDDKDTIELYKKIYSLLERLSCGYCAALHVTQGELVLYNYEVNEVNEVLQEIRKRVAMKGISK